MIWTPRTTVAAVIENNQQFLVVEELINGKLTLNQPAGHLEHGESLIEAVIRETREETAWQFIPSALVGIYRWIHPQTQDTFLRFCFTGNLGEHDAKQALDKDIERCFWLSKEQLFTKADKMRSPLVLDCFKDYLDGQRYPLSLLHS
jgi:ADP-ribose pyrophosphatase YjhB (NUDIX family)